MPDLIKDKRQHCILELLKTGHSLERRQIQNVIAKQLYDGQQVKSLERLIQNDIKDLIENGFRGNKISLLKKRIGHVYKYQLENAESLAHDEGLSNQDRLQIIDILRGVDQIELFGDISSLIQKVKGNSSDVMLADNRDQILFFDNRRTDYEGNKQLKRLVQLVAMRSPLKFCYQAFEKATPDVFVIHPYSIREYNMRYYLCGLAVKDGNPIYEKQYNFALDRLVGEPELAQGIDFIECPFPDDYYSNVIGFTIPDGVVPTTIKLAFTPNRFGYVSTKPLHESQSNKYEKLPDGRKVVTLNNLIVNKEFKSILLQFGADCEVLEPQSLREDMQTLFRQALELYSD